MSHPEAIQEIQRQFANTLSFLPLRDIRKKPGMDEVSFNITDLLAAMGEQGSTSTFIGLAEACLIDNYVLEHNESGITFTIRGKEQLKFLVNNGLTFNGSDAYKDKERGA